MKPRTIVRLNRMPLRNRGCRRLRVRCETCGGGGSVPRKRNRHGIGICPGCHGNGFYLVWKRGHGVEQKELFTNLLEMPSHSHAEIDHNSSSEGSGDLAG